MLFGGDVQRLDIHEGALDGDDQEIPTDHLRAPRAPTISLVDDTGLEPVTSGMVTPDRDTCLNLPKNP